MPWKAETRGRGRGDHLAPVAARRQCPAVDLQCVEHVHFHGVVAFILATAVRLDGKNYISNTIGHIWDRGFSRFNLGSMVGSFDVFALIPNALAVNSIQALLSLIVLIYNALFTRMLSGLE